MLLRVRYDKALEDYTKYLELNPDHAGALYQRGNCYRNKQVSSATQQNKAP